MTETANKAKIAADQAGDYMTKKQALRARGWIQPIDYIALATICASFVTLFFWWLFGQPTALNLIAVLLVDILVALFWLILLVFRSSCFVLETQADINLMPESAARIVAGYFNMSPSAPTRARK